MLRSVDPTLYHTDEVPRDARLRVRYLGTAGFVIETSDRSLVIDPFVTRPGLLETGLTPLRSDAALVRQHIPRADEVLIGHAHHDHILDAPMLCKQTGARLIGSAAACNVGRAAGLPETQLVETAGREEIACGPVTVRGLPSLHGKVYLNRVPLPGDITEPPPWPPRFFHLRHGLVLNWWIEAEGRRIVHIDSAEFIDAELESVGADIVCLCAAGWTSRERYVEGVIELLKPRYVLPCHWDWFFRPIGASPRLLPGCDLAAFIDTIRRCGAEPITLPILGEWGL